MNNLKLDDLQLGLNDLLSPSGVRLPLLEGCEAGRFYRKRLEKKAAEINALLPALSGRARAGQLAEANELHDGFGAAVYLTTEAYLRNPRLSAARRQLVLQLREAFVPSMSELKRSHADHATRAEQRRGKLAELEPVLKGFPLADGETLYDWVKGQLDAGAAMGGLLSARATDEATVDRRAASRLRSETLGSLYRLREEIAEEVEEDPSLPRNLEALLFGYFDELDQKRAAQGGPEEPTPGL